MRIVMNAKYLLSLIAIISIVVLGVRIGDVWTAVETGKFFGPAAQAETTESKSDRAATSAENDKHEASDSQATAKGESQQPAPSSETGRGALAAPDSESTEAEAEILNQLSKRREDLDKRSRDLDTKESLIKVAERRVDQKIGEMEALRKQLQGMVSQVSEAQAVQIDNLVKIYETMKPEEAARIFDTLDMPVLLGVIQRMKPKSTAPILAKMSSEKAKEVTVALTKQDELPKVK